MQLGWSELLVDSDFFAMKVGTAKGVPTYGTYRIRSIFLDAC